MRFTLRSAAARLPLFVMLLALAACGGGGGGSPAPATSGGGGGGGGGGTPPPAPAVTPPSALSYTMPQPYTVGTAITPLDPTVTGTVTSYSVAPALPPGLSLDTATGRISGTPTAIAGGVYTVTAANAGGNTTFALSLNVVGERVTADRPDEQTGNQVHVMYVLPSDGADEHWDHNGAIEASLNVANDWLKTQTGGKGLRFDTYGGGKLDVTFLQLQRTDAQMNVAGGNVRLKLESQLLANGFDSPQKIYLVYYGGDGDGCGRGAWPPSLPGNVGAVYVGAASNCMTQPFALAGQPAGMLEFIAIHETLHVTGLAAACAPHHNELGHVSDSVTDLMFGGSAPGRWQPSVLDLNHDDYFGHAIPGCRDLANSAFLEPLPAAAEAPPGWPYENLTDLVCGPNEQNMPRQPAGAATKVLFVNTYKVNGTEATVGIYESVYDSVAGRYNRSFVRNVPYNDGVEIDTFENTVFVAVANNTCVRLARAAANPSRFVVKN